MKMKKVLIALSIIGVLAGGGFYLLSEHGSETRVNGLRKAPRFKLPRSNGEIVDSANWKDEVIVVHFWAAWCPPCIPEIPEVLAAAKSLPKDRTGRPIHWVLVSQDPSWEKAHSIVKEETLPENTILVLDSEAQVSELFGSYQFPETYVVNRDGGVAAKMIGAQAWSGTWGEGALAGIEELSREKKVSAGSGMSAK